MSEMRFKQARTGAWAGIVGKLVLAAVEATAGVMAGSKALIADAAHTASDVAGSLAVLIGLKTAQLPPDRDHPYGHGKAESVAAVIASVLLVLVGIEIGIHTVESMAGEAVKPPAWYALPAVLFSIVVKEGVFQYKIRRGRRRSSQAPIAGPWEHRSDVYSSLAALVGVGGAVLGGYVRIGWLYYLDPAAGLFAALLVVRMGYRLLMESIPNTLNHVLHREKSDELVQVVQKLPGVISVDDLRAREHGHYVVVDVKISVNPKISVMEGHDIAKSVKTHLMEQFSHVSDVLVHVNPYDPGFPYKDPDTEEDHMPTLLH